MSAFNDHLADLITTPGAVRSASRSGAIRFGSSEVRDLSDGAFPVEVYSVVDMGDGTPKATHEANVRGLSTLDRATKAAGRGWRAGAVRQWVEVRTPWERTNEGKIAALRAQALALRCQQRNNQQLAACYEEAADNNDTDRQKVEDQIEALGGERRSWAWQHTDLPDDWMFIAEEADAGRLPKPVRS